MVWQSNKMLKAGGDAQDALEMGREQGGRVADKVRELVDGLPELHQSGRAVFIDSFEPGGNRIILDEERACSLGERPAASGLELEDGHAFGGGVMWSSSRFELGDASVLDAEFLAEQLVVLLESVVVGCQSDPGVDAVGGPAAGDYDGIVGQADNVQNG